MPTEKSGGAFAFCVDCHREVAAMAGTSRVNREVYARLCGRLEVKSLRPTRQSVRSAKRYCRSHDELRNFLRCGSRMCQHVPAATRRFHHMRRTAVALGSLEAA